MPRACPGCKTLVTQSVAGRFGSRPSSGPTLRRRRGSRTRMTTAEPSTATISPSQGGSSQVSAQGQSSTARRPLRGLVATLARWLAETSKYQTTTASNAARWDQQISLAEAGLNSLPSTCLPTHRLLALPLPSSLPWSSCFLT